MDAVFATIRCYVASLAADMALLQLGGHASDSDAVRKLESDAAGFMRASLRMYNMMEESPPLSGSVDAAGVDAMIVLVDEFVRDAIDPGILCPEVLSCTGSAVSVLRDHTLLLANTLRVLREELSGLAAGSLCADGNCSRGLAGKKRERK